VVPTRVYLIDDDEGMRASAQFLFETLGIPFATYSDPYAFLHAVKSLEPGCILTDWRMPSMSGLELHSALIERGIEWPFVLMSGHAASEAADQALQRGILDFLEKPFQLPRLMDVLARAGEMLAEEPRRARS
jgi:FixJ family two-component response regulator